MPVLAELCLPLVNVGGFLIAYKVRARLCPSYASRMQPSFQV